MVWGMLLKSSIGLMYVLFLCMLMWSVFGDVCLLMLMWLIF